MNLMSLGNKNTIIIKIELKTGKLSIQVGLWSKILTFKNLIMSLFNKKSVMISLLGLNSPTFFYY